MIKGFVIFLLVLAILCGAIYVAWTQGYLDDFLPMPGGWVKCVGTCTVPLNQEMRLYSTDVTRKFQVVFPKAVGTGTSVQFKCDATAFGLLAATAPKGTKCAYRPIESTKADADKFTLCGVEGAKCTPPIGSQVRMFAQGTSTGTSTLRPHVDYTLAYPTSNITPFTCEVQSFPFDPASGKFKVCYYTPVTNAT